MPRRIRSLEELEIEAASDLDKGRRRRRRQHYPYGGRTRIAMDTRAGKRMPPPVPEGLSLEEIKKLDPDDPRFRHPQGAPRKREGKKYEDMHWKDGAREAKQARTRKRRAKIRRHEAVVVVTAQERGRSGKIAASRGVDQEDQLVEDGELDLDDWDDEEIIRGYRRNRRGKFGPAPRYIPREVQQEVYRRLILAGDREFKRAYLRAIKNLVELADSAESEKVQLDASRELINRVGGKVPDRVHIGRDEPWQEFLGDSLERVRPSELPPLDVTGHVVGEDGDGVDAPLELQPGVAVAPSAAAVAGGEDPPSPTPRRRKSSGKKKTTRTRKTSAKREKTTTTKRTGKVKGKTTKRRASAKR